jgi:hypothetical protein
MDHTCLPADRLSIQADAPSESSPHYICTLHYSSSNFIGSTKKGDGSIIHDYRSSWKT